MIENFNFNYLFFNLNLLKIKINFLIDFFNLIFQQLASKSLVLKIITSHTLNAIVNGSVQATAVVQVFIKSFMIQLKKNAIANVQMSINVE